MNLRRVKLFLISIMMLFTPLLHVYAYDAVDVEKISSITISYLDEGSPIQGAEFRIYRIASVDKSIFFTLTEEFQSLDVQVNDLSDEGWMSLADTLKGYIVSNQIQCLSSVSTDAYGNAAFTGLLPGLYLVLSDPYISNSTKYSTIPYIVSLPNLEDDIWNYDVTSTPKHSKVDIGSNQEISALKIWKDEGHENDRPSKISVSLYQNQTLYDVEELSVNNDWTYTWQDLDARSDYTIVENDRDSSYSFSGEWVNNVYQLTNTYKTGSSIVSTSSNEQLPFTGIIWWPIPVIALVGLGFYIIGYQQKKKHE